MVAELLRCPKYGLLKVGMLKKSHGAVPAAGIRSRMGNVAIG